MRRFEVNSDGISREIEIALQTIDCVVPDGEGSYLASPISTGRRLIEMLSQHKMNKLSELVEVNEVGYVEIVRKPNVAEGEVLASKLRRSGVKNLINTGPLFVNGWDGSDYMEMCFEIIRTKISRVFFHREWAYSSGAVEEYLFCKQHNIPCLDESGGDLTPRAARDLLNEVSERLETLGLPTTKTDNHISDIRDLLSSKNSVQDG